MEDGNQKEGKAEHKKCLECSHINCANFFWERKENELDGGELFVLNRCIEEKKIVPCQPINPIYSSCLLIQGANESLKELVGEEGASSPMINLLWQCLYDLKASAFLALTAHYRSASQLLRPIIENILVAAYFEERIRSADTEDASIKVWKDFTDWTEDEFRVPENIWDATGRQNTKRKNRYLKFGFLVEWLLDHEVLMNKEKIEKTWRRLNKYLHPNYEHMDVGKEKCSICPATTRFDESRYTEWLDLFQNIIVLGVETLLSYFPESGKTAKGHEGLVFLKNLETLEKDLDIHMIESQQLRRLISNLPEELIQEYTP